MQNIKFRSLGYPMADYLLCGSSVELLSIFKLWWYVRINHIFFLHTGRCMFITFCVLLYIFTLPAPCQYLHTVSFMTGWVKSPCSFAADCI